MKIDIQYDDREVQRGLNRLLRAAEDLSPAMREIAGHLVDAAEGSLERQESPAGAPWQPLAEGTRAERRRKGYGAGRPILERSGDLIRSVVGEHDAGSAAAGTNLVYAAIHQFGGEAGMPPGPAAVPARPFLGVDDDTREEILDTIRGYLRAAVRRRSK